MKRQTQGFTLLELLIVIAVIGILASTLITSLLNARQRAYDTGARSCAKSLQTVEAISQVDRKTYIPIGASVGKLNRSTDGVDASCKQAEVFVVDRSTPGNLVNDYTFDIWDKRGSKVITVTPGTVQHSAPGATPFSDTGAGGSNLP